MILIRFLIIYLLCFTNALICQTPTDPDLLPYTKKEVSLNKRTESNAEQLVKKLIKNKTGDQEKFDAIFTWVTTNIKYDYSEFYSPTADVPASITRILKTKRTICLGYSNLMDTLCMLAGITNVTVYGYAKDDFFDVNDTIYGHNHAWNAVKLDNLWYVYDATWSMGKMGYKLTARGKWITRWFEKHPEKLKKKKIRNKYNRKIKSICGEKENTSAFYYKQRFFNRLLRNRMALLTIGTRKAFVKGINKDFYLSEPKVFAITHIPDSPIWNLGSDESMRKLETDSAFYYLTDSVLKSQTRQGTECPKCDAYVELPKKEKLKDLNTKSRQFNKHNEIITAYCEERIGMINFLESKSTSDSLTKVQFLDSAAAAYTNSRNNLQQGKKNLSLFVLMHKTKNKHKQTLLLTENKGHMLFVSGKVKQTLTHQRNFTRMSTQGEAHAKNYLKRAKRTSQFKINLKTDKLAPYAEKTLKAIHSELAKREVKLDTLNRLIAFKKQSFDSLLENMSLNIWQQVKQHDSLIKPFVKCTHLRREGKDNYKKVIVDIRKKIPPFEARYAEQLNTIIYGPSGETYILFNSIVALIKAKAKLQNECLTYNRELMKAKEWSYGQLDDFRETIIKDCEYDFCWVAANYPKLITMKYGLAYLKQKQDNALNVINIESSVERYRHSAVNEAVRNGYGSGIKSLTTDIRHRKLSIKAVAKQRKEVTKPKKK